MFEATQFIDKTCPICGKNFIPAGQHMYRDARNDNLVCSWTCMLKSERMNEVKSNELEYIVKRIATTKRSLTIATEKPNVRSAEIDNLRNRLAVEENIYNIILEHIEAAAAYDDEEAEED